MRSSFLNKEAASFFKISAVLTASSVKGRDKMQIRDYNSLLFFIDMPQIIYIIRILLKKGSGFREKQAGIVPFIHFRDGRRDHVWR